MGAILQSRISAYFDEGANGTTTIDQGRVLENLVCYLFESTPGITVTERNVLNAFHTEEVDVAFWNDPHRRGLRFLPHVLLVECKNWSRPVGSQEVAYFVRRLRNRGLDFGLLVSTRGVSGSPADLTDAHYEIATALKDGVRVVVIDRSEIEQLFHSDALVRLIKRKLCMLAVRGTCF